MIVLKVLPRNPPLQIHFSDNSQISMPIPDFSPELYSYIYNYFVLNMSKNSIYLLLIHIPPLFSISVMVLSNLELFLILHYHPTEPIIHQALPILPGKYLSSVCQFRFISTAMSPKSKPISSYNIFLIGPPLI